MKTTIQLIALILLCTAAKAQQNYFVYIQTDNKQPFYVKMNDKVMSSSGSGYVVIPKLNTGTYTLNIGFPKDQWPQQTIPLVINNSDAGYLLKNFAEKGWGLYNLQSMEVTMNGAKGVTKQQTTAGENDVFTNTLSGAANTDVSIIKKEKPAEPVKVVKPDLVKKEETQVVEVKQVEEPAPKNIKKIKSINDVDGKSATYVDNTANNHDTISIFIPAEKKLEPVKAIPVAKKEDEEKAAKKETKFLDIDMQNPNATTTEKVVVTDVAVTKPIREKINKAETQVLSDKPVVNFNSDCKANADENDFLKLRKKMAANSSDDGMISTAAKFFKSTCFSVDQIKNLSLLFLNDDGKYKFFDAAYPHINDTQNFASLQNQLTDEYYISRFKAMIHQ